MTPSTFIARVLGPLLVVVGLGLLLEGPVFHTIATEFLRSPALIYLAGIVTFAIGLAILNVHNLWVRDWRVILTVFGWLALIGGIFRILATSWVQKVGEQSLTHPRWAMVGAVLTLVLGGFLTVMGYQDIWNEIRRATTRKAAPARGRGQAAAAGKRPAAAGSRPAAARGQKRPQRKPAKTAAKRSR